VSDGTPPDGDGRDEVVGGEGEVEALRERLDRRRPVPCQKITEGDVFQGVKPGAVGAMSLALSMTAATRSTTRPRAGVSSTIPAASICAATSVAGRHAAAPSHVSSTDGAAPSSQAATHVCPSAIAPGIYPADVAAARPAGPRLRSGGQLLVVERHQLVGLGVTVVAA
jgi:hypothetical protein